MGPETSIARARPGDLECILISGASICLKKQSLAHSRHPSHDFLPKGVRNYISDIFDGLGLLG
jgi:hypothetical protein